ncbi:hypothetical protein [Lysinibacillus xylanilyticus]|uniref:hypothetical protein n=1 Tax=Lysinibacillus xylanilyticus TaxID=582475 RepID=UPI00381C0421
MGYRFDMQNKSTQAQAIVRKRDREEELKKSEKERIERESEQNKVTFKEGHKNGDYEVVVFEKGQTPILELRVSGTAIANEPCGLDGDSIHEWLGSIGENHAKQSKSYEIVMISSTDVVNKKIVTEWNNLKRI